MNVPMKETASERDSDAAVLEQAAAIIRRRFGVLTAGDLIAGLTSLSVVIRADGGIIPPVAKRNQTLERHIDESWDQS